MTEMGRQPWIVFGVMKTASAVSPNVGWGSVLTSLIVFTLLYGALAVADVYLLQKYARIKVDMPGQQTGEEQEPTISVAY